eukprot:366501-Chlamydomonas_euryale.AAC.26
MARIHAFYDSYGARPKAARVEAVHAVRALDVVLLAELRALLGVPTHAKVAAAVEQARRHAVGLVALAVHLLEVARTSRAHTAGDAAVAKAQWEVVPAHARRVLHIVLGARLLAAEPLLARHPLDRLRRGGGKRGEC